MHRDQISAYSLPALEHPPLGRVSGLGWGRGCDGRSDGTACPLGWNRPVVGTLTCCCYHSPCDQLRNSKYFLSDKGDWGRSEISGRVWASLRSKHQAREVGISPGSAGFQVQSGRGPGWCGNRASCLSLTFNPPPAWAGRTFPACFPLPLVWNLVPRGHIWDQSCAEAELSQLVGWFPGARARHSPQVSCSPQLWLQQLLLSSQGKERGSGPSLPVLGSGCACSTR